MKYLIIILISCIVFVSCADSTDESDSSTVATPVFNPPRGTHLDCINNDVSVDSSTDGASIYYKIDASGVTVSDTLYDAPIDVNIAQTIYAIAVKEGMTDSAEASADYTVQVCEISL